MRRMDRRRSFLASAILVLTAAQGIGQTTLLEVEGEFSSVGLGRAVSALGDLNTDGVPDFLVGAPLYFLGEARVLSGVDGSTLLSVGGNYAGDGFANSVAGIGDVSMDGVPDLLVGIPNDDDLFNNSGSVQVFSGADGSSLYHFYGKSEASAFGQSLASAGDLNADGFPDYVVGAPKHLSVGVELGRVEAYSGRTGLVLLAFNGQMSGDRMGFAVAGAGDVNQDGHDDVLVGIPFDDDNGASSGSVRVISGKNGGVLYHRAGDSASDLLGWSVSTAGDLDGDGVPEFMAGAPLDDDGGQNAGSARVYRGLDGATLVTFHGILPSEEFGSVLTSLDMNGDGATDLVASARKSSENGLTDSGSIRVFSGTDFAPLFTFVGPASGENFGAALAPIGDLNGDGVVELGAGGPNKFVDGSGGTSGNGKSGVVRALTLAPCGPLGLYGQSCPGPTGAAPLLFATGCAIPGADLTISVVNAIGAPLALLVVGSAAVDVPIGGGCSLLVGGSPLVVASLPLGAAPSPNGSGDAEVKLPLSVPAGTVRVQAFLPEPASSQGFYATNALSITVLMLAGDE